MKRCSRRFTKSNPLQLALERKNETEPVFLRFFVPVSLFRSASSYSWPQEDHLSIAR